MSDQLTFEEIMHCFELRMKRKGHEVVDAGKIDAYGDLEVVCPRCQKSVYIRPTAEEKRKRVFTVPHVCNGNESVTWHIRRELTADELLGFLRDEYPEAEYQIVPIRSDN